MNRDMERGRLLMLLCAGAALALATLGCGRRDQAGAYRDTTTSAAGRAPEANRDNDSALTDVAIASKVMAANSADSAAGALAATKATNAAVRSFGQQMVRDHGQINQRAKALATRLNVTPVDNEDIREMREDAEEKRRDLQGKSGAEFDREYMDYEVEAHENVLRELDRAIPAADNADLRQLLTQGRATVQSHLDQARQIRGTLR